MPLLKPNKPVQIPMPMPQQQYKPPFLEIDERRNIMKSDFQEYPSRMSWKDIAYFLADPAYGPTRQQPVADSLKAMGNRGDEYGIWRYVDYLGKNRNLPVEGKPYSDDFYKGLIHTQPEEEQDSTKTKKQGGGPLDTEVVSKRIGDENLTRIVNKYRNQPNDTTYTSMKPGNIFYHNTGQNLPGGKPLTNISLNRQPVDIQTVPQKSIQDSIAKIKSGLGLLKTGGIVEAQVGTKLTPEARRAANRKAFDAALTPEIQEQLSGAYMGAGALKNVGVNVGREILNLNKFLQSKNRPSFLGGLKKETSDVINTFDDIDARTPRDYGALFRGAEKSNTMTPGKFNFDKLDELYRQNKPKLTPPPGVNKFGGPLTKK